MTKAEQEHLTHAGQFILSETTEPHEHICQVCFEDYECNGTEDECDEQTEYICVICQRGFEV